MYKSILHITLWILSLLFLPGCQNEQEILSPSAESSGLSIRLVYQAGDDIPECERVKDLRLIIIDDNTGKVDKISDKQLFSSSKLTKSTEESADGSNRYIYTYEASEDEITPGTKTIYALANAEQMLAEIQTAKGLLSDMDGNELIAALNSYKQEGNIDNSHIPITSRKNTDIKTQEKGSDPVEIAIEMVYAAVKFDLTITNKTGENISLLEWGISQLAEQSYLIPRIGDTDWETLMQISGTSNNTDWVYDYEIPEETSHTTKYFGKSLDIADQQKVPLSTSYWHESKSQEQMALEKEPNNSDLQMPYSLHVKIRTKEMDENSLPIILSAKLENLRSLVRNTHVVMDAAIEEIPASLIGTLEVRVKSWIVDNPVEGGWEEVNE